MRFTIVKTVCCVHEGCVEADIWPVNGGVYLARCQGFPFIPCVVRLLVSLHYFALMFHVIVVVCTGDPRMFVQVV